MVEVKEKLLTIVICAYNMERYIERALQSCILEDVLEQMEIIVLNDGSQDSTAELTQKYCDKYPQSIVLVNKENGGWGSNINIAVEMATGKYFKILDADDWFEKEILKSFVYKLHSLETDMIMTRHQQGMPGNMVIEDVIWQKYDGQTIDCKSIDSFFPMSIWDVTFRTEVLKREHIELPNHVFYTDVLFILQGLFGVNNIYFYNQVLYNYFIGRDEQSMSMKSQIRHYKDALEVVDASLEVYKTKKTKSKNIEMSLNRLNITYCNGLVERFIKLSDVKEIDAKKIISEYDTKIQIELPELYTLSNASKLVRCLRKCNYHFIPLLRLYLRMKSK